jgi:ATP-dependent DNA helicase RecQ
LNKDFQVTDVDDEAVGMKTVALDTQLVKHLQDLRKQIAKQKNVPPWVIFQDPSLNDMATTYPITMEEMGSITGVSAGKAQKYGRPFVELIKEYVEENQIDRPADFIMKQVADRSKVKVSIIQSVDRKIPFEDIAYTNNLTMDELFKEMDMIVSSGTKLDISYYLDDNMDESIVEEVYDYLMEADSDSVDEAYRNLKEDDVKYEEIQLIRIKFLSEVAN